MHFSKLQKMWKKYYPYRISIKKELPEGKHEAKVEIRERPIAYSLQKGRNCKAHEGKRYTEYLLHYNFPTAGETIRQKGGLKASLHGKR